MKRKIFSILVALVLALSLCLVTAVPVAATEPGLHLDHDYWLPLGESVEEGVAFDHMQMQMFETSNGFLTPIAFEVRLAGEGGQGAWDYDGSWSQTYNDGTLLLIDGNSTNELHFYVHFSDGVALKFHYQLWDGETRLLNQDISKEEGAWTQTMAGTGVTDGTWEETERLDLTTSDTDVTAQVAAVPEVVSVSPASGDAGTSMDVVITGTGFVQDSIEADVVTFSGAGVDVTVVKVDSDTQITADVTIAADAPAGAGDVSVTIGGKTGTGTGLFTVNEFLTLTAPTGFDLGMMTAGDTATGSNLVDGNVVTNVSTWSVGAVDVKVDNTGHMVNAALIPLTAPFKISTNGSTYADADAGITYGSVNNLPFYVSQFVANDDPAGSYSITITFTGWY